MSNTNDDVYVDLLLTNSIQSNANNRVAVSFMQNSSQPILKSTNGYKLSIIRFSLNTETLPIFIPVMKDTSKVDTIYSITMQYNGISFQQFMQFEPQNLNPTDPDEYFYVYSYQYLIYLVNKCLSSCFNGLMSQLTSAIPTNSPIMSFDNNTQKCAVSFNSTYYGYNESNKINIYMNNAMYTLFASLPAMVLNNSNGMNYQLNNLISSDPDLVVQDYSTVAIWNPISSVIFTSNLLPIYQSQTPPVQIYTDSTLKNSSSTYNFLNILTDFVGDDLDFVPYIQYAPSIYRFLSVKQNTEIRNIDLQVYWNNRYTGELKKLYLGVGGTCSVKLFLTKDY
jgi:hypothetical protein